MTTIGELQRRFERDRVFAHGGFASGPAVTPAGSLNHDLALRFGTYGGLRRPNVKRMLFRFALVVGENAEEWVRLSTIEMTRLFPVGSGRVVVRLRR